jgi:signal transduction histidine kinase
MKQRSKPQKCSKNASKKDYKAYGNIGFEYQKKVSVEELYSVRQDAAREVAAIAHDIMQPAQALSLFIDALQKEIDCCCKKDSCDIDRFNDKVRNIVEKLAASSESLHELLYNVFRSSSLDAGAAKIEISTFPMSRVLAKVGRDFDIIAEEKGVELNVLCKGQTVVDSDPIIVERILRNLVCNAIKYTNKDGKVTVGGRRDEKKGKVTMYVNDTGIGIPKNQVPLIFDRFYRGETDSNNDKVLSASMTAAFTSQKGMGIGLATVATLANMIGTTVNVETEQGKGSEFYFDLPINPENII